MVELPLDPAPLNTVHLLKFLPHQTQDTHSTPGMEKELLIPRSKILQFSSMQTSPPRRLFRLTLMHLQFPPMVKERLPRAETEIMITDPVLRFPPSLLLDIPFLTGTGTGLAISMLRPQLLT